VLEEAKSTQIDLLKGSPWRLCARQLVMFPSEFNDIWPQLHPEKHPNADLHSIAGVRSHETQSARTARGMLNTTCGLSSSLTTLRSTLYGKSKLIHLGNKKALRFRGTTWVSRQDMLGTLTLLL
jgi:hypothetical protein